MCELLPLRKPCQPSVIRRGDRDGVACFCENFRCADSMSGRLVLSALIRLKFIRVCLLLKYSFLMKIIDKDVHAVSLLCLCAVFWLPLKLFASLRTLVWGFCLQVAVVASWAACMGIYAANLRTCLASLSLSLPLFSTFVISQRRIIFVGAVNMAHCFLKSHGLIFEDLYVTSD